ncbi:MAG: GxxExxY protein [Bacteroidia bacterium]
MSLLFERLTSQVIKSYFDVFNTLGHGFLERVYENALCLELDTKGISYQRQKAIEVYYRGNKVGYYVADIIVENELIIEVKAAETLREEHECQLINYLRATNLECGLLMNFGKKPEFRRKIFTNEHKSNFRPQRFS